MKNNTGLEIAVIGMAGRFPGASDIHSFWENLKNGKESIRFFSDEEILASGEDPELLKSPAYVKAHGLLEDKEYFDSTFFDFIPDEAKLLDPQVRIFHECVWSALEDAGIDLRNKKSKVGLFAGASSNVNWELYSRLINKGSVNEFAAAQLSNSRFAATKLSYFLDTNGPAVFLDTACSTSLVAIHEACQSLLLANCNVAIAGGVSITNKAERGYLYSEGMIYSKDGHCRTFDAEASGTVGGEGSAVVVLKKLKNAIQDGDNIWAVIKGSSINNDGHNKVGYTAPSIDGQTEAVMHAQKWAKVDPKSISLIEAHGTATKLGDPIEVEALNRAFGTSSEKYCALGSVKSNIGHLDAAAGAAGFIKAVLSLHHRQIPPSLHYKSPNPEINFNNTPFYVNTECKEWKHKDYPLRAGVSAFGVGGTNAHVILEEAPAIEKPTETKSYKLLPFSGKTPSALQRNLQNFREFLDNSGDMSMSDVAYTLQSGRTPFVYRKALVIRDKADAIDQLSSQLTLKKVTPISDKVKPRVVFMFTGAGAQFANMYLDLYRQESVFRNEVNQCLDLAKKISGKDFKSVIFPDNVEDNDLINSIENTQPTLFIMEYALARSLMKWGINPDLMIGHSFGQYVAACISGVFSLEEALKLIIKRGEVMLKIPRGAMLSISISENRLKKYLKEDSNVSLAAINSSELCVVSGEEKAIDDFKVLMDKEGYKAKVLLVSVAGHSYLMDGILEEFEQEVASVEIKKQQIPFISNVSGEVAIDEEIQKPSYWSRHLREPVKFADGIEHVLENKYAIFIEVGPANVLSTFVRSHALRKKTHHVVNLVRHPKDEEDDLNFLLTGLGRLWSIGLAPDWKNFHEGENRKKVSLPTYSFDKRKYPVNVDAQKMITDMTSGSVNPLDYTFSEQLTEDDNHDVLDFETNDHVSSTEQMIIRLWQNFFGKQDITVEDDFFEIGGDSLKALTMIGQLKKTFDIELGIKQFFSMSGIRTLSTYIDAGNDSDASIIESFVISQTAEKSHYVLSSSQQRLFFLYQFEPNSLAYNIAKLVKIDGKLQLEKLEIAFNSLVMRHESLRTSFKTIDDLPAQVISKGGTLKLEHFEANMDQVDSIVKEFVRPFNLNNYPLMRAGLIKVSEEQHVLMLDMHHIMMDGLSENILINDLLSFYNEVDLPVLGLQYKDYAEWQQSEEQLNERTLQKGFWLNQFDSELVMLDLPYDFPRPSVKSYEGDRVSFEMNATQVEQMNGLARKESTTLFMVLLSAYNLLLSKLGNQEDIAIGTPVGGRNHIELENIVGMFVNTLVLRNYPKGDMTFKEFLSDVKERSLGCFDNQTYPYEELVDELKLAREPSRNPLFDVMFIFQNFEEPDLNIPGLSIKPHAGGQAVSQVDLTLSAVKKGDCFLFNFEYSTQLFKRDTVLKFAEYFQRILSAITLDTTSKLSEIDILSKQEKIHLLKEFNNTSGSYPREDTIVSLFEKQVSQTPHKTAVVYEGNSLTYFELNQKANNLSMYLTQDFDITSGDLVGIMMDRSELMLVGLLGILKAGGVYVPIDPTFPKDRVEYLLEDSKASTLLMDKKLGTEISFRGQVLNIHELNLDALDTSNPLLKSKAEDLCYMIYTSGSTGKPKGVMISHYNVVNFITGISDRIPTNQDDSMLAVTSTSFDISVLELFWTLCNGIEVVIHPSDIALNSLDRYMPEEDVSMDFGLFFFASYNNQAEDKYRLLLESVEYADKHGFKAAWTPERHFHEFGGLYPNPSVTSSALAMITDQIELRSGSIVSPLHDSVRIAEEWSVVDNLSKGRIALSFASGWNPNDFAITSERFEDRHNTMYEQIETVKNLWKGGSIKRTSGNGKEIDLKIYPRPIQEELPVWITSGGNEETFKSAGAIGANLLTHFLGQDIDRLANNIRLYREARVLHGHDKDEGKVAIMLHTYVGDDIDEVEAVVKRPFIEYLKSSIGLVKLLDEEAGQMEKDLSEEDKDRILESAFRRYYQTSALIGTKSSCSKMIQQLKKIGVDEIACLVDFGVEEDKVLSGLEKLKELKGLFSGLGNKLHKPITMMQSTPSFMQLAEEGEGSRKFLGSLKSLMLGGEALPYSLIQGIQDRYTTDIYNMYGPTETTIWSCVHHFENNAQSVSIGKPILNTQVYVLDKSLKPVPIGVGGDVYIGGDGVSLGYWQREELTNEKFLQSPFNVEERVYHTGDIGKWLPNGTLELMGRKDHQVKIRGYRIELGEIESCLLKNDGLKEAVVVVREQEDSGDKYMAAYLVADEGTLTTNIREYLGSVLPSYMIPNYLILLDELPLTPNGKIDRKALPDPEVGMGSKYVAPSNSVEEQLVTIWSQVLELEEGRISVNASFFELGGHSLKATVLINKIQNHFSVEIPLQEIFNKQTVESLADYLITVKQIETELNDENEIIEITI